MRHLLQPLLVPASVALVGASEREGALGRVVFGNLLAGGFHGEVHAVNPHRRQVSGMASHRSLAAIGKPVDLAVIATPARSVLSILDDAVRAGVRAAVLITAAPAGDSVTARRWRDDVAAHAKARDIRITGPGAFGVIRTDVGLNATFSDVAAIPGRLALVSQSGAVCTAMLDFASPMGIGFSSVLSVGDEIDVDVGELLDALLADPATDGILVYLESVANARGFLSALRAAARAKPVVVLKAGRSLATPGVDGAPSEDDVFDTALHRAGTVRVDTYMQLFAAARALAMGRIPRGDRIAIVANGRGPALLAADRARDIGVPLAKLAAPTLAALEAILPGESVRGNPVDVRGTATAARYAAALQAALDDPGVDAVIALHVPRPIDTPVAIAHAVAQTAKASRKPVLAAWLGAVEHRDARLALEAGSIADFYTPENAVDAFSFLAAYRRNQEWLLEAPSSRADTDTPDIAAANAVRAALPEAGALRLDTAATRVLLTAFGIAHVDARSVRTLADAHVAARHFGFPVVLIRDGATPLRAVVADAHALDGDFTRLAGDGARLRVVAAPRVDAARAFAVGVHVDPTFGPVITLGATSYFARGHRATMLPPLSRRLACDMVDACGSTDDIGNASRDALLRLLLQLSALVCALPWVRAIALEPVIVGEGLAIVADAHIDVDTTRKLLAHYAHMAIHPYPVELEGEIRLRDGARLAVRPMRPGDVDLEQRFVAALSDESRYLRFFYQLHALTPQLLARFTQVDYDREMALVALPRLADGATADEFVGVARYIAAIDRHRAEFAIVVADAWQGRGVGERLMQRLMDVARASGVVHLEGTVLRSNVAMLRFVDRLGFAARDDAEDPHQVMVARAL
ncbi:MAG: GNAT family N-acetyltransferase [Betaproteobacteria bacterium]